MTILTAKDFTVPTQLDEKHRKTHGQALEDARRRFDRAYMREMVEDHDTDVKKFRQEAEHGNDADLKSVRAEDAAGARAAPEDGARPQQVVDRGRLVEESQEPLKFFATKVTKDGQRT